MRFTFNIPNFCLELVLAATIGEIPYILLDALKIEILLICNYLYYWKYLVLDCLKIHNHLLKLLNIYFASDLVWKCH